MVNNLSLKQKLRIGATLSPYIETRIEKLFKSLGIDHVLDGINIEVHRD
jgi:hypothetical protein